MIFKNTAENLFCPVSHTDLSSVCIVANTWFSCLLRKYKEPVIKHKPLKWSFLCKLLENLPFYLKHTKVFCKEKACKSIFLIYFISTQMRHSLPLSLLPLCGTKDLIAESTVAHGGLIKLASPTGKCLCTWSGRRDDRQSRKGEIIEKEFQCLKKY